MINVHAGTYAENLTIDKTLTVQASPGNSPIVRGHIEVTADDVTISGLEVTGWGAPAPLADGILQDGTTSPRSGLTITNCKIHAGSGAGAPIDVGGLTGGTAAGIRVRNSAKTRISGNDIYGCKKGIRIQSSHSTDGTYANGTVIANNKVHDCPIDGLNIQGQYVTVQDCTIYNNMDLNYHRTHPDGIQFIAALNTDNYSAVQHSRILSNTIYNQTQQIFLQGTGGRRGDQLVHCADVLVANNVCYIVRDATVHGVLMSSIPAGLGIGAVRSTDIRIYNNTVMNLNCGIGISNCRVGTVQIKNNILQDNNNAIKASRPDEIAPEGLDHNLYFRNRTVLHVGKAFHKTVRMFRAAVPGQDVHAVESDPKLDALPTPSLRPGSRAVGAGVNLFDYLTTDRAGITRPFSGAWDIGAYQFVDNLKR